MTSTSIERVYPWLFNETLRADKYDSGPPFIPPGLPIPSHASLTDPFAEPIFARSDDDGARTLQRMVNKPTIFGGHDHSWHAPGTALEVIGKEAKNDSKSTQINDGSWMKDAPEGWIKANFHVRIAEVQEDGLVYNSKVGTRALTVSGDSQPPFLCQRPRVQLSAQMYAIWDRRQAQCVRFGRRRKQNLRSQECTSSPTTVLGTFLI
jgi:hypothetical protein